MTPNVLKHTKTCCYGPTRPMATSSVSAGTTAGASEDVSDEADDWDGASEAMPTRTMYQTEECMGTGCQIHFSSLNTLFYPE